MSDGRRSRVVSSCRQLLVRCTRLCFPVLISNAMFPALPPSRARAQPAHGAPYAHEAQHCARRFLWTVCSRYL